MKRSLAALAFIFLSSVSLLVYAPSFGGKFVFDDVDLVVENPLVAKPDLVQIFSSDLYRHAPEVRSGYYRPLQTLSYAAERRVFGLDPRGYRVKSALLHGANAFLLFVLLSFLFGRPSAAFAAALLFLVSPLHAAAVAYVSGRAALDALFFSLASLVCFERFLREKRTGYYAAALVFALPAAFCRESALLLPLFALVVGFTASAAPRRAFFSAAGYLITAACYVVVRTAVIAGSGLEHSPAFLEGLAAAGRLTALFVLPADAHPMRTLAPGNGLAAWAAGFVFLTAAAVVTARVRRDRAAFFSAAWFAVALLPLPWLSGFFGGGRITAAEHWFYVAAPGLASFAALAFGGGPKRAVALAVLALAAYAPLASAASRAWTGNETLYRTVLSYEPANVKARLNLASLLRSEGRLEEAGRLLETVERAEAGSWDVELEAGQLALARGDRAAAKHRFERALALRPRSPQAFVSLGALAASEGNVAEARRLYDEALCAAPDYGTAEAALGELAFAKGDYAGAAQRYARAAERGSGNFALFLKWGTALGLLGRYEESIPPLESALRLEPESPETLKNLGASYANAGRSLDAERVWRKLEKKTTRA